MSVSYLLCWHIMFIMAFTNVIKVPEAPNSNVLNTTAVKASDVVLAGGSFYGFFINQHVLESIDNDTRGGPRGPPPRSSFPYTRLTSIGQGNSFFLYSQINSTTFVENFWDHDAGDWHEGRQVSIGAV